MASDNKLDDSGSLLMKSSGEQRGTGAGTNGALQSIKIKIRGPFLFLKNWKTCFTWKNVLDNVWFFFGKNIFTWNMFLEKK